MAFKTARIAEVTVATKALSTFCDSSSLAIKVKTSDVTTFLSAWDIFISGTAGATFALSGSYDPTVTTGPSSVLLAQIALNQAGTVTPCIVYPAGNNAGQGTSDTFNALLTDYTEDSKVQAQVVFSCTFLVTGAVTHATL